MAGHRPDRRVDKAAPLCLGPGPELSVLSVRLRANPREIAQGSGKPGLGKEHWGLGGLLSRKDWRPVRQGLRAPVCGT